jgi:hypothetical protein
MVKTRKSYSMRKTVKNIMIIAVTQPFMDYMDGIKHCLRN